MGTHKKIQNEIKKILNEEFSNNSIKLGLLVTILLFVAFAGIVALTFNKELLIYYIAVTVFFIFISVFLLNKKNKNNRAKAFIKEAFDSIRVNKTQNAMQALIEAYKTVKNRNVLEFIFLYTTQFMPDLNQQAVIAEFEYDQLKAKKDRDKQLIDILQQIKKSIEGIQKHSKIIKTAEIKIEELKNDMEFSNNDEILLEFNQLIKRYNKIIENSKKRIELLREKIEHLSKLKHNFILLKKLNKAREELKNIEQEMWSDYFIFENEIQTPHKQKSEITIQQHKQIIDELNENQEITDKAI